MVHRKQWERLPITKEVIDRVNHLGSQNGQRAINGNSRYATNLMFESGTESESDDLQKDALDNNDAVFIDVPDEVTLSEVNDETSSTNSKPTSDEEQISVR